MGEVSIMGTLPLFLSILVAVAGATLIRKLRGCSCEPNRALSVPARAGLSAATDALSAAYVSAKRAETAEQRAHIWSEFDPQFYHAITTETPHISTYPLSALASRFKIPVSTVKLYINGLRDAGKLEGTIDPHGGCFIRKRNDNDNRETRNKNHILQLPREEETNQSPPTSVASSSSFTTSSADDIQLHMYTTTLPSSKTLKKSNSYGTFSNNTSVAVK